MLFRAGRQHVGGADRRRLPRRPLRPARVHARRRGLLRPVPAGRHAGARVPAGAHARADDRGGRRSLHPAGGRRLRRDERLQRVRAAASIRRQLHRAAATSTRRPPTGPRRWPRSTAPSTRWACAGSTTRRTFRGTAMRATSITTISGRSGTRSSRDRLPVFIELSSTPTYDRAGYLGNLAALDALLRALSGASLPAGDGTAGRAFRRVRQHGNFPTRWSRPTSATTCSSR